jgi:hypothetical protein
MKNNENIYHYVYIVIENSSGMYYIGSRSCACLPEEDTTYKGSQYQWKLTKEQKALLIKKIIKSDFTSRFDANIYEAKIIKKYFNDPLNKNGTIPDGNFHTKNKVIVKDKNGKIFCVNKEDERYISGELVSVNKNRKLTDEHISKISWKGKKHSDNSKQKISQAHKGKSKTHKSRAKKLYQYDLNWNFVKEWNSLTEAAKSLNTSVGSLSTAVNHEKYTRVGYRWKY